MIIMWAKEDAKAVARPTMTGEVPDSVPIGTVIGPIAATVAPSLIKLVRMPLMRLHEMQSPVPLRMDSGSSDTKPSASHSAPPVVASP